MSLNTSFVLRIGNAEKEKNLALDMLHNFIAAKKKLSQWSKVYESLMKRHLELCIDLKNPHLAKDGLHQYRNLCQTVSYTAALHTHIMN